jgi:hypothetical protein
VRGELTVDIVPVRLLLGVVHPRSRPDTPERRRTAGGNYATGNHPRDAYASAAGRPARGGAMRSARAPRANLFAERKMTVLTAVTRPSDFQMRASPLA